MPFSKAYSLTKEQWTEVFEHKIKSAVEESGFGYECERYELRRANITKAILQEINSAHLVIADLTGKNPNVLWELGVRHTLSKRTVLIAQDKKFLPSDLKDYPIILYKYKQTPAEVDKFKDDIKKKLEDIETDPDKPDSPVADFLQHKNVDIVAYEKISNLKKMSGLLSELSENLQRIDILTKLLKKIQKKRKTGGEKYAISLVFNNACLELLLTTQYILLPKVLFNSVSTVKFDIDVTNKFLYLLQHSETPVENNLLIGIPSARKRMVELLKVLNQVYRDYMNNNYVEPERPIVILTSPEHEEYLKLTE